MNSITIKEIIETESVSSLYQPIISLINGEITGYEALSRGPENTYFHSPLNMIQAAEEEDCIWELEMLFRKKAIEKSVHIPPSKLLFLNVDPKIIQDSNYKKGITKSYLNKYKMDERDIVLEITERTAIDDYDTFKKITRHYQNQKFNIAIDDVGSGYSGLKSITELKPQYLKIDMDLIRDIDQDPFKTSIIKGLVSAAKDTDMQLIAEGVETPAELKTLIKLGVQNAQGYLLHRPSATVASHLPDIRNMILQMRRDAVSALSYDTAYFIIGKICNEIRCFDRNTACSEVKELFDHSDFDSITICNDNCIPEGLVMRNKFNSKLADRYGYDLYSQRPIHLLMNVRPLIIDFYTPVNQVLPLAMQRDKKNLYDDIVVTKNSEYFGVVSIHEIILYTTEYEKMYAKQLNPLTLLPGNTIIRQVLEQYINTNEIIGLLYVDLDHFKAYNDVYGFEEGDIILKRTGQMIEEIVSSNNANNFVGHIGGDDYVAIIQDNYDAISQISQQICDAFEAMIPAFFNEEDRSNGYYTATNRYDEVKNFPLTSITIAALYGSISNFGNPEKVGQHMSAVKREAKAYHGNTFKIIEL